MNSDSVPYLVSPKKKSALHLVQKRQVNGRVISGQLLSEDGTEIFPIVAGIPLLQPKGHPAEWGHPIYEILFGDKAFETVKHFHELNREHFFENISAHIADTMGKAGIRKAFERYRDMPPTKRYESFVHLSDTFSPSPVPGISKSAFARSIQKTRPQWGKRHLEKLKSSTWATHLPEFVEEIVQREPKILVELGCGACLGTQAVVESCRSFERLFTLDIDFACTKVAEGLFTYQGEIERVEPVVGNFWFLPIKHKTVDVVFSHYGIDESREIDRILEEISGVLKLGGTFISISRMTPNFPLPVFDELGFSADEEQEMASMARLYAGPERFCEIALSKGLKVVTTKKIVPSEGHARILFVLDV